jgi:hypothetical protein
VMSSTAPPIGHASHERCSPWSSLHNRAFRGICILQTSKYGALSVEAAQGDNTTSI